MADPFGIGAGIVGVMSLTIQITQIIVEFAQDWKGAPDEARSFMFELGSLKTVLSETHANIILNPDFAEAFQGKSSVLLSQLAPKAPEPTDTQLMLDTCQNELKTLLGNLDKRVKGHRLGWERFKGALLTKGTRNAVEHLRRQCQTLNSMMSIDTTILGVTTFKEVKSARAEQRQYHDAHSIALSAVGEGVDQLHERHDNLERREEHLAILDWLSPHDYAPQQSDYFSRRQKGTGQWLLDSKEFKRWLGQSNQTLFCPGIPGAGKTIITSIVINHLHTKFQDKPSVGIAYLYCNFQQHHMQKLTDLLLSLLWQLAHGQPSVPELKNLASTYKNNRTQPPADEISKALRSVAAKYLRVFIIVDALDECQIAHGDRKKFLSEIFDLQSKTSANVFATSRFIPEILKEFEGSISQQISANRGDVQSYLEGHMSQLPSFVSNNTLLQEEIKTAIINAVDGMFLLAQLHLASLSGKTSPKALRLALQKLSTGSDAYDHAYDNAMERINGQHPDLKELAKQTLSWTTCARRRLTTSELRHALAVELDTSELDEQNLTDIEQIISVCAGLVTVDTESDIVRLVHYTTQQYFERTWKSWFPKSQSNITKVCVTYLSFDIFETGFSQTDEEFEARLQSNVLYDYAARNWGHHARFMSPNEPIDDSVLAFLRDVSKVEACSQAMMSYQVSGHSYRSQKVPENMTALHLAAYFGIEIVARALLSTGDLPDPADFYGRGPLSWAAQRGHEAVVKLLVENSNVSVDSRDNVGRTPLSYASQGGSKAIFEVLLEKGVHSDSRDKFSRTPLSWAAEYGHESIVKHLLDSGKADKDSKNAYGLTPVSWAALRGHERVLQLLLKRGANADPTDQRGRTPLSWAAGGGYNAIAKLLLESGADVNSRDKEGRTPLSHAAESGSEAVVKLLLTRRSKTRPDLGCKAGRTPLSYAAEEGHSRVAELLLKDAGVNPDAKDDDGWTPLMWAADEGRESVLKVLLKDGRADPRSRNEWKQTPLSRASRGGHAPVLTLLLRNGVEPDSEDITGWTPLLQASMNGHQTAVDLLVKGGANPDHRDINGRTSLSWAASLNHGAVVKYLLSEGIANPNSRDKAGQTPLFQAARNGHEWVVRALVTAGADPNTEDMYGRTVLKMAAMSGYHNVVKLLLEYGANVDSGRPTNGWTALELAVIYGHREVEDLLRAKGASAAEDFFGLEDLFAQQRLVAPTSDT